MIRNVELNSREYELICTALEHVAIYLNGSTMMEPDERKMLVEEHLKLHKRFKEIDDVKGPGVYIDGVRQ